MPDRKNKTLNSGKWFVSSANFDNVSIGEIIDSNTKFELRGKLPGRLIPLFDLPIDILENNKESLNKEVIKTNKNDDNLLIKELEEREALEDLYGHHKSINKFPHIQGTDEINEKFVVLKMLARYFELPLGKIRF